MNYFQIAIIELALSRMISTWDQFKLDDDDILKLKDVKNLLKAIKKQSK